MGFLVRGKALGGTTGGPRSRVAPGIRAKTRTNSGFPQLYDNDSQCLLIGDRMPCFNSGTTPMPPGPCGGISIVWSKNKRDRTTLARSRWTSSLRGEQSSRRRSDDIKPPARPSLPSSILESYSGLSTAAVFAMGYSRDHKPFQGALLSLCGKRLIDLHSYS
jgi:hypothetical protein